MRRLAGLTWAASPSGQQLLAYNQLGFRRSWSVAMNLCVTTIGNLVGGTIFVAVPFQLVAWLQQRAR
ncbi:hypothetical protein AWB95_11040 [Mycobacterium celatum]|uniref:Uncharacterized protein n=1 Tax=Mycobacterium celatum TaxID=28045 RepID=A0A1X1RRS9_MYCCE|nr:hypothetical protein AWB95_11040 [Mycobacterium celatum]